MIKHITYPIEIDFELEGKWYACRCSI